MNAPFTDWRKSGKPAAVAPHNRNSPNLLAILAEAKTIGGTSLGSFVNRPVRGGTALSIHAWGAAADIGFKDANARRLFMEWLIANSAALHVQEIHDYSGVRPGGNGHGAYWRSDRQPGWKPCAVPSSDPAMSTPKKNAGATWVHVETNMDGWADASAVTSRGVPALAGWNGVAGSASGAVAPAASTKLGDLELVGVMLDICGRNLELFPKIGPGAPIDDEAKRNLVRFVALSLKHVGNQPDTAVTEEYTPALVAGVAAYQQAVRDWVDPTFSERDGNIGVQTMGWLGFSWASKSHI